MRLLSNVNTCKCTDRLCCCDLTINITTSRPWYCSIRLVKPVEHNLLSHVYRMNSQTTGNPKLWVCFKSAEKFISSYLYSQEPSEQHVSMSLMFHPSLHLSFCSALMGIMTSPPSPPVLPAAPGLGRGDSVSERVWHSLCKWENLSNNWLSN